MRAYLPATLPVLRELVSTGEIVGPPLTAFAVTPGLREWYQDEDQEELEYAATMEAARSSLRALDDDPHAPRRRVVVALEVAESAVIVRDDRDRGVVEISTPIALDQVAAVHLDDAEAEAVVARAAESVVPADLGDPEAQDRMDDAEGLGLSWYDSQELPHLLQLS